MTSNASPYAFVSLDERYHYLDYKTRRKGTQVQIMCWYFTYTRADGDKISYCFGIDELDAYRDALKSIAHMEKQYFKRQEAKHVAAVQG